MSQIKDASQYKLACPNCKQSLTEVVLHDSDDCDVLVGFAGLCGRCTIPLVADADDEGKAFLRVMTPQEFDERVPDSKKEEFLTVMLGHAVDMMLKSLSGRCKCPACMEAKEKEKDDA